MPTTLDNGATVAAPGDAAGALITGPRQIEYAGLLLGSGTPFHWKSLAGWDSMPAVDLADGARPSDHGDTPGLGWFGPRLPSLTWFINADTRDLTESLAQLLAQRLIYSDAEQPLVVRDSGRTLTALARVVDRTIPHDTSRSVGRIDGGVQWKCSSPLRFLPGTQTVTLSPTSGAGTGLSYPLAYPLDYGAIAGPATANLTNRGEAPAPARIVFTGPATSYLVRMTRPDGTVLRLGFSLPMLAGDTLTVDTGTGSIRLNGTSDRTGWLTVDSDPPELWRIQPGTSQLAYTATGTGAGSGVSVTWTDTVW